MKHLKPFNESLSFDDKRDIKDICLELSDMGFEVTIDRVTWLDLIIIDISKSRSFIYTQEIHEIILRILDYMKIKGLKLATDRSRIRKNTNIKLIKLIDNEIYCEYKNIKNEHEPINAITLMFRDN